MKIQVRRDTTSGWSTANPTLALGEYGLDTDLKKVKIGDGATAWTSLPFQTVAVAEKVLMNGSARTIYVTGPTGPSGASEGDIWIKTA